MAAPNIAASNRQRRLPQLLVKRDKLGIQMSRKPEIAGVVSRKVELFCEDQNFALVDEMLLHWKRERMVVLKQDRVPLGGAASKLFQADAGHLEAQDCGREENAFTKSCLSNGRAGFVECGGSESRCVNDLSGCHDLHGSIWWLRPVYSIRDASHFPPVDRW